MGSVSGGFHNLCFPHYVLRIRAQPNIGNIEGTITVQAYVWTLLSGDICVLHLPDADPAAVRAMDFLVAPAFSCTEEIELNSCVRHRRNVLWKGVEK